MAYTDLGIPPPPSLDVAAQMQPPGAAQTPGAQLGAQPAPGPAPAPPGAQQPPGLPGEIPGEPNLNLITSLTAKLVQMKPGLAPVADGLITKLTKKISESGTAVPATPLDAMPDSGGAIQTAVSLEAELAKVDFPELLPDIRYFIATMREEVSRDQAGGAPAVQPPLGAMPAVNMGTKVPVSV